MSQDERQVGGTHYKSLDPKQEHWNLVLAHRWDYFQSQIIKYVMRWRVKGGIQDLEKAHHFLEKYIEAARAGEVHIDPTIRVDKYTFKQAEEIKEQFITEGSWGLGEGEYTCRRCGTRVRARNVLLAFEQHGDCAGANYVNQG